MSIEIQKNIPLAQFTTLQVGGVAEYFCAVRTEAELCEAIAFAKNGSLDTQVLGGGSNVLIADSGLSGLVIKNEITGREEVFNDTSVLLTVGSGAVFDEVVAYSVQKGWWGLENLSHIPGTIGATPVQNVGAYGVEVADLITAVRVYDVVDEVFVTLTPAECAFGYRDSVFKHEAKGRYIVTGVTYKLSVTPQPKLSYKDLVKLFPEGAATQGEIRNAVIAIRSKKFPDWNVVGTAGSFFKNPVVSSETFEELSSQYPELPGFKVDATHVKVPLGYILDKILGIRGVKEGAVGTYEGQALVVINEGGASAEEIKKFAQSIVAKVHTTIGIDIEWEVTTMG